MGKRKEGSVSSLFLSSHTSQCHHNTSHIQYSLLGLLVFLFKAQQDWFFLPTDASVSFHSDSAVPSYREMPITYLYSESELRLSPSPLGKIMSLHIHYHTLSDCEHEYSRDWIINECGNDYSVSNIQRSM